MVPLSYSINQPVESNAWNGEAYLILIFKTMEFLEINSKNMFISLLYIANYIRNKKVKNKK